MAKSKLDDIDVTLQFQNLPFLTLKDTSCTLIDKILGI